MVPDATKMTSRTRLGTNDRKGCELDRLRTSKSMFSIERGCKNTEIQHLWKSEEKASPKESKCYLNVSNIAPDRRTKTLGNVEAQIS